MSVATKYCTACNTHKPANDEYFYEELRVKCGLSRRCKECIRLSSRVYGKENSDKIREKGKQYREINKNKLKNYKISYYLTHADILRKKSKKWYFNNREYALACRRLWNYNNKEKIKHKKREYYLEHREHYSIKNHTRRLNKKEKVKQEHHSWYKNNSDKIKLSCHKRRLLIKQLDGHITIKNVREKIEEQQGKCYWCGTYEGKKLTIDHVIPITKYGSNSPENIVLACFSCNSSKGNKLLSEWKGNMSRPRIR